ncbi:hypothetical protein CYLTODRAFT_443385 [Cylindrobasidium torrendii FP15055 ss-10]|uniref:Large ribosomal subunit protein uL23m n=1 Tax=Cylindrobasidium torrendii FP15055 ss-10 TaxID=1314674 RepID=A0A0D7BFE3_9AGAR|nr:hypothetical protein CYLTODRAFT_443385 [Cylindrobasidium torrendii FP15055 ss-10]
MTTLPHAGNSVCTLPDDVLREIFVKCVPRAVVDGFEEGAFPLHSSLDKNYPPWTLSQVNQNWRALALSTPELWSTCSIMDIPRIHGAFQRRIDLYLRRSEPLPVDISVRTDLNSNHNHVSAAILAASTRWRCVRFGAVEPTQFRAMFQQRQFPALTHLSVCFSQCLIIPSTTLDTPALLHFEQNMRSGASYIEAPWDQIIRYKSDKYNLPRIMQMPKLEALYAILGDDADPWDDDDAVVGGATTFANLSSMYIMSAADNPILPWFLSRFQFPSLATLACIYPNSHAAPDDYYLTYGYARSGLLDGVIDLMEQTPGIVSLHFFSSELTWGLLEKLHETGEHPTVLKRLKTLYITPVSPQEDLRFVASTLRSMGAPFEELSVYKHLKKEQEETQSLKPPVLGNVLLDKAPLAVRLRRMEAKDTEMSDDGLNPSQLARYRRLVKIGRISPDKLTPTAWLERENGRRQRIRGVVGNKVTGTPIFLPTSTFGIIPNYTPPGDEYNPNYATFYVPLNFNKPDIRSYLQAVYGVPVTYIRTAVYMNAAPGKRSNRKVIKQYKKAVVGLVEPFYFPHTEATMTEEQREAKQALIEEHFQRDAMNKAQRMAMLEQTMHKQKETKLKDSILLTRDKIIRKIAERRLERENLVENTVGDWKRKRKAGETIDLAAVEAPKGEVAEVEK